MTPDLSAMGPDSTPQQVFEALGLTLSCWGLQQCSGVQGLIAHILGFSEDFSENIRFLSTDLKHKSCEENDGSDPQIDLLSPWEIWCNRLILEFRTDSELDTDSKMNDTIQIPSFMNAGCKIHVCKEKVGTSHYNSCVIESLFKTRLVEYKTFKDKTLITQIHSHFSKGQKLNSQTFKIIKEREESQEPLLLNFFSSLILILWFTSFEGKNVVTKSL